MTLAACLEACRLIRRIVVTPMCWTPSRDLVNSTLSVTTSAPYSSRERTTAHQTKRLSAVGMGPQRSMGPITACLALLGHVVRDVQLPAQVLLDQHT